MAHRLGCETRVEGGALTTAAVSAAGVTDRASDDRPASTDERQFARSSRGLTNAEAGERLMEARFARILLDSLAA